MGVRVVAVAGAHCQPVDVCGGGRGHPLLPSGWGLGFWGGATAAYKALLLPMSSGDCAGLLQAEPSLSARQSCTAALVLAARVCCCWHAAVLDLLGKWLVHLGEDVVSYCCCCCLLSPPALICVVCLVVFSSTSLPRRSEQHPVPSSTRSSRRQPAENSMRGIQCVTVTVSGLQGPVP